MKGSRKKYLVISGVIFGLVSCLHLVRLAFGWPVEVGIWTVPFWVSWGGLVAAGALSIWAFRLVGRD